jgi:IS5 family transposase
MERVVPWAELEALVEPHYPKAGNGRRPVGLQIMLRTYFMQQWFDLSDPGVEEALYESATLRRFAGVDLGVAPAPDETTVLRFRHLLEKHDLGGEMLETVNRHLEAKGSASRPARSSTPASSMRRPPPRTRPANATRRCIKRKRATSGTLG